MAGRRRPRSGMPPVGFDTGPWLGDHPPMSQVHRRLVALTDLLTVIEIRDARPDQRPRKSRRRLVISAGFSSQSQWPESLTTSPVTSAA